MNKNHKVYAVFAALVTVASLYVYACTVSVYNTTCVKEGWTTNVVGNCVYYDQIYDATPGFDRCDSDASTGLTDCGDEAGKTPHQCQYIHYMAKHCVYPSSFWEYSSNQSLHKADQIAIGDQCPPPPG